jgi:hypothetical protein
MNPEILSVAERGLKCGAWCLFSLWEAARNLREGSARFQRVVLRILRSTVGRTHVCKRLFSARSASLCAPQDAEHGTLEACAPLAEDSRHASRGLNKYDVLAPHWESRQFADCGGNGAHDSKDSPCHAEQAPPCHRAVPRHRTPDRASPRLALPSIFHP